MYAARSSQVAARTSGVSPAKAQIALFALSAGIAGFGGAMYGLTAFSITATSIPPFLGLIWLAVAVTFGIRRPGGALLAGLAYTASPVIWQNLAKFSWMPNFLGDLITSPYFTPMLFGLGAINLAKNPDGLLAMVGHDRLAKKREKEREDRIAAAESVLHEGEAAPEIVAVLERETDPHRRGYVARSLGSTGDPDSLPVLYKALAKETDPGAKGEMRGAIQKLGGRPPK